MSIRKEKISAFLDNDMHRDELMSFSLSTEADDARVAQRYQMVGDALRGEMSDSSFIDISQAVREALASENIAEQMTTSESRSSAKSSPAKTDFFDLSAWFKPLAGMAVAASVAVVMVVTVTGQDQTGHNSGVAPVATNTGAQLEAQPAQQLAAEDETTGGKETNLNSYINQHLEFATQDTLQGRLPYVRAVSFESRGSAESGNRLAR